jgi:hypothetical protein
VATLFIFRGLQEKEMGNGCTILLLFPSRYVHPKLDPPYQIRDQDYSTKITHRLLTTVSPYCPNIVLSLLHQIKLVGPISHSMSGACMLADICGFTKFSGDLCQEGVTGIDKLRRITSSFLSKFIDTICFYYGDGKFPFQYSFHIPPALCSDGICWRCVNMLLWTN